MSIDVLDTIISVGKNLFFNSPMEACVVICNRNKPINKKGKVYFVNARDQIAQDGKYTYLSKTHIEKICKWYRQYEDIPGRSKIVENKIILQNKDCSLSVSLYASLYNDSDNYGDVSELISQWNEASDNSHEIITNLIKML